MISADYPGALTRMVEESLPAGSLCLFLQGACGDINPLNDDTRNFDDVEKTGSVLAGEIISLFGKAKFRKEAENHATLRVVCRTESFKSCPLPDPDQTAQIERGVAELERRIAQGNNDKHVAARLALLQETLTRIRQGDEDRTAFLQLIRIGNTVLFAMPFEPCCLLGRQLKQMAVPLIGIPVGYANGYLGYVMEHSTGAGYETSCGPWNQLDQQAFNLTKECFSKMLTEL